MVPTAIFKKSLILSYFMVWPILVGIAVILFIALIIYKKDNGKRAFLLNSLCLACHKRFPDNLSHCPYCNEPYFSYHQK